MFYRLKNIGANAFAKKSQRVQSCSVFYLVAAESMDTKLYICEKNGLYNSLPWKKYLKNFNLINLS